MCKLFGISRNAYYKGINQFHLLNHEEEVILSFILNHRKSMPRIGTRKLLFLIKQDLDQSNIKCGRDRLFDILRNNCLLVGKKKNFTKTTNSLHRYRKYPNRIKNIQFDAPEQLWVSDITYIKTKSEVMYLALITDAVSKKIMGYNIDDNMRVDSCLKALEMALNNRSHHSPHTFHHSDRGLQYCSPRYTDVLEKNNFSISMTENHDPYENAVAERVNGILKNELGLDSVFENQKHAISETKKAIEIYNLFRPHLTCDFLVPDKAHCLEKIKPKSWSRKKLILS